MLLDSQMPEGLMKGERPLWVGRGRDGRTGEERGGDLTGMDNQRGLSGSVIIRISAA